MEQYRNGKGKGKGFKGSNPWGKGGASKGGGEKGGGWGKGSNIYWFDQEEHPKSQSSQQAWAFAVSERSPPPGLPPPLVTSKNWLAFASDDEEQDEWPHVSDAAFTPQPSKTKMMKKNIDTKKKFKAQEKEDDALMQKLIRQNEHAFVFTEKEKPVEANMVQGPWRQKEAEWIRVQSVMDSGCGCSVAPPGMCPAYPIHESEGSLRGQEFMSASEHELPNLGEQVLNVVMGDGKETSIKYAIADVSRALNAVTEICDHGNRVIFGRGGGIIENIATGKQTPFKREGNIYSLEYWVKPFTGQVR